MILNRQSMVRINAVALRSYVGRVREALELGVNDFNVCLVDNESIRRLNSLYRGKDAPTDVLSFPWEAEDGSGVRGAAAEFRDFLGDIVIGVETARENARADGHSTQDEICLLVLHGVLHLLGYDHELDHGEMTRLELSLRERLALVGQESSAGRAQLASDAS
jgi:probable rRNA maturation factor